MSERRFSRTFQGAYVLEGRHKGMGWGWGVQEDVCGSYIKERHISSVYMAWQYTYDVERGSRFEDLWLWKKGAV